MDPSAFIPWCLPFYFSFRYPGFVPFQYLSLQDVVLGPGLIAFSAEAGGDAGVRGWEAWVFHYSEGHGAKAANDGNGGDRVCVVDEIVIVECREMGVYLQRLSRVAKSIVGQGGGGVRARHVNA